MRRLLLAILFLLAQSVQAIECPRVISQSPYITHSLTWLGLEHCIVGVSRYDTLELARTGGILDPDKEAIDSLMADIVFTTNWITHEAMKEATPVGVQFYRLDGFDSMAEISHNLLTIGRVMGVKDIENRISFFQEQLSHQIRQIKPNNKKVLLLSSCTGAPYSFGKRTWLYDLFKQIGFDLVETHDKIRHIKPGNEIAEITTLLDTLQPEILFIFERKLNARCNLILPKTPLKIVTLDGQLFLHPAPILLKGLDELHRKQALW